MQTRIAILGRREAFHGAAACYHFGAEATLVETSNFDALIQEVQEGRADCGVMAWENSLAGPVPGNQERLRLSGLNAADEILLSINLHLAALPGTSIADLREVHSHPMALKQVSHFLEKHPWIVPKEATDTANAARLVAEAADPQVAAVTGPTAAAHFGLNILQENVENRPGNQTRFLVIQQGFLVPDNPERLLLSGRPDGGIAVLAQPLAALHKAGLKLRRMDSLTDPDGGWKYQLHLDFTVEGRQPWAVVEKHLALLPEELILFGAFAAGKTFVG
jgi:prephenate dehydratase